MTMTLDQFMKGAKPPKTYAQANALALQYIKKMYPDEYREAYDKAKSSLVSIPNPFDGEDINLVTYPVSDKSNVRHGYLTGAIVHLVAGEEMCTRCSKAVSTYYSDRAKSGKVVNESYRTPQRCQSEAMKLLRSAHEQEMVDARNTLALMIK